MPGTAPDARGTAVNQNKQKRLSSWSLQSSENRPSKTANILENKHLL